MANRPFFPHVIRAVALALIVGACSSGGALDSNTDVPTAPSTSTSTSSTSTSTSTTSTTMPPTLTLRGDVPPGLQQQAEQIYNHLIDPANEAPAMPAALLRHIERHQVEPGVVRAEGNVARMANGDRVGVVTAGQDGLVFVNPAGRRHGWELTAAILDGLAPWVGPAGVRKLLVIGSDARIGENQLDLRADSVHILTLRPRSGEGALVGFPRDSWIWGSKLTNLMPGRGPDGMVEVMEDTTGVQLEGWVAVGFEGFLELMRSFGNLAIHLPDPVASGNAWASYPDGPQVINPLLTLQLARIRKTLPNGDFDRSVNQGRIIVAALAMVKDRGLLYLPDWVSAYSRHGFTNLDTEALVTLAAAAHVAKPREFANIVVPGSVGWVGAASVVFLGSGAEAVYDDLRDGLIGNE